MIAMTEVSPVHGSCPRVSKNAELTLAAAAWPISPLPSMSSLIAVPPKTVNHAKKTRLGTPMTPRTNSRTVRPFEIFARNTPTKAPQLSHHAIMKYVQNWYHSTSPEASGVRRLVVKNSPRYWPVERKKRLPMNPVGPTMRTKRPRKIESTAVVWLRNLIPLLTPDSADRVKTTVMPRMMMIWTKSSLGIPKTRLRPSEIWEAPRPSDVVVPKSVAMTAMMSTTLPGHRSIALPKSGLSIGEMSPVFPRLCVE